MGVKGLFVDFFSCPACNQFTRHYEVSKASRTAHVRKLYCEGCGVVRVQFRTGLSHIWEFPHGHAKETPEELSLNVQ